MSTMQPVLALEDVRVVRGDVAVLDGISAQITAGRCTALAGPSGAGKSTLLRLLDRLEEPTSGRVLLHGRALPSYDVLEVRRRVGLVQQAPVLLGATVLEDLRTGRPSLSEDEARDLLARAGLGDQGLDRLTVSLSGGEAQRLCLARALAVGPEVLLLDEPTSALDAVAAMSVERVVRSLVAEGLTAVLVSHDLRQARRLADDVVVLRAGRVEEAGPAAESEYLAGAS
ncbi:ATP-binding cassette domain-containing protein [Nocardioides sp.]|uniref:ATP-binding cassette domain-containing protein n=1 Tax=Nocardioides sp. TaxID=35761 RepID=UPI002638E315|nr:ATP-binding cassette domain-containing protein [Nocardioides sp.]MCW2735618.1 transporter [Nocardioides sp.]